MSVATVASTRRVNSDAAAVDLPRCHRRCERLPLRRMRLTINGEPRDVDTTGDRFSVDDLLRALQLPAERVAVEHNGSIVRKAQRAAAVLSEGDRLELVTLVGGG